MSLATDQYVKYLWESARSPQDPDLTSEQTARAVACFVARWATRFQAWPVGFPDKMQDGVLPPDIAARCALLDQAFDAVRQWLDARDRPTYMIGLRLFRGDQELLDQHDGIPLLHLWLTAAQAVTLQDDFVHRGWPPDLFFPEHAYHFIVEPTEIYGGVVRMERSYSPREWAQRDEAAINNVAVPNEADRRHAMSDATRRYWQALQRRLLELREPGTVPDERELFAVRAAQEHLAELLAIWAQPRNEP